MQANKGLVLLVDDDTDVREALRDSVADEGYCAIEAQNGQEALDYLRSNQPPCIIFLDWNMSPVNGSQFMAEASQDPALARIPVVLVTADSRAAQKSKRGFAAYLTKPIDMDSLFALLSRYCGRGRQ